MAYDLTLDRIALAILPQAEDGAVALFTLVVD